MRDLLKKISISVVVLPLLAITLVGTTATGSRAAARDFDAAATYKAKCAMCHGQKAEKKFDATKTDEALVEATLKGVETSTPKMPGYEARGMTPDQAKALVAYMRSLKQ